jgi:acetyl esterase/lipase
LTHHASTPPEQTDETIMLGNVVCFKQEMRTALGHGAEFFNSYYLAGHDANNPYVPSLYANLTGLPPIRIHVGEDEMLFDDSVRFAERANAAGVDVRLDVWQGMVHGFVGSVGRLSTTDAALPLITKFLVERFAASAVQR